jgi:hypothetical protein
MVESAKREPSVQDIVVALRETKGHAGTRPPLSVIGNQRADAAEAALDIAVLRDREVERLLAENAELNRRMMSLLKLLDREPASQPEIADMTSAVREAVAAELRPVMLTVLRLLERRHPETRDAVRHDGNWIVDLDGEARQ